MYHCPYLEFKYFQASERNQGDDNGSELSNETNTVDSGKGSSVSDVMARDIGKSVRHLVHIWTSRTHFSS